MKLTVAALCVMTLGLAACDEKPKAAANKPSAPTGTTAPSAGNASVLPASLFLAAEPANPKPVSEVKKAAKAGDSVVIRGRIGGSEDPFVAGRAVFTIMSPEIKACSDNEGDGCKTPWDYCCESKEDIAAHSATIQVVDGTGAPIKADVKGQGGIKELSELIIVGKVAQAEGKVLLVNATGMYLAKK